MLQLDGLIDSLSWHLAYYFLEPKKTNHRKETHSSDPARIIPCPPMASVHVVSSAIGGHLQPLKIGIERPSTKVYTYNLYVLGITWTALTNLLKIGSSCLGFSVYSFTGNIVSLSKWLICSMILGKC